MESSENSETKDPFYSVDWEGASVCDNEEQWLSIDSIREFSVLYQRQHGTFSAPLSVEEKTGRDLAVCPDTRIKLTQRYRVQHDGLFVTIAKPPEPWTANASSVSKYDQRQFLFHLIKFRHEGAQVREDELESFNLFLQMQSMIKGEQKVFEQTAKQTAERFSIMYETLLKDVNQFVTVAWKTRLDRLKSYPPFYIKKEILSSLGHIKKEEITSRCQCALLSFGNRLQPLFISMGGDVEDVKVSQSYGEVVSYEKIDEKNPRPHFSVYKTSVSQDMNAQNLAITHQPDIVISISALKVIGDNSEVSKHRQWYLPIRVLKHKVISDGKHVEISVVYVDKPLPKLTMSAIQKNKWFYKYSAKRKIFPLSRKAQPFENIVPTPKTAIGTGFKDFKRYSAWELHGHKGLVKLIVRSSIDGAGEDKAIKYEYVISAKPEYQPWAGAEVLTESEINREWIGAHFRPGVITFRTRLDVYTGEIILYDKMSENRILWEARRLGYYPADAVPPPLTNIYSVLSKLKGLKEGTYLLSNEANTEGFFKLWETTAEKTPDALDVQSIYSKIDPSETAKCPRPIPWLPIDVETVTFSQKVFGRIPGTFEPERGPWKHSKFGTLPRFKSHQHKRRKKKKSIDKAKVKLKPQT